MNVSKEIAVVCLIGLVLSVSACGGLTRSDKPATQTWWLEPYTGMAHEASAGQVPLVAVSVTAVPGLDTYRILTLSDDAQLNQYASARWTDNLPELITSLLGRSLEASGRFEVVSARNGEGSENCELKVELQEFFADLSSSGQTNAVRVAFNGHYQCDSADPLSVNSSTVISVNGQRMSEIVAAFQQATDIVMKDLLAQLP